MSKVSWKFRADAATWQVWSVEMSAGLGRKIKPKNFFNRQRGDSINKTTSVSFHLMRSSDQRQQTDAPGRAWPPRRRIAPWSSYRGCDLQRQAGLPTLARQVHIRGRLPGSAGTAAPCGWLNRPTGSYVFFCDQNPEARMPGAKVVVQFVDAKVGGRQRPALLGKAYRPHFRVEDGDYLGVAFCGDDSSRQMQPSTCVSAQVAFVYAPEIDYSALSAGVQFRILEGAMTAGIGVIIELIP
ncbi:hypothetical protein [Delftia tsuruhatensis]|uniref:hypothetical protein n=1 Tax=Delftia tsuruhatensis TaxID=180282 RepID=UPI00370BC2BC